jgi:hypothetical protein
MLFAKLIRLFVAEYSTVVGKLFVVLLLATDVFY